MTISSSYFSIFRSLTIALVVASIGCSKSNKKSSDPFSEVQSGLPATKPLSPGQLEKAAQEFHLIHQLMNGVAAANHGDPDRPTPDTDLERTISENCVLVEGETQGPNGTIGETAHLHDAPGKLCPLTAHRDLRGQVSQGPGGFPVSVRGEAAEMISVYREPILSLTPLRKLYYSGSLAGSAQKVGGELIRTQVALNLAGDAYFQTPEPRDDLMSRRLLVRTLVDVTANPETGEASAARLWLALGIDSTQGWTLLQIDVRVQGQTQQVRCTINGDDLRSEDGNLVCRVPGLVELFRIAPKQPIPQGRIFHSALKLFASRPN